MASRKSFRLVYGVGFNSEKIQVSENGNNTRTYVLWRGILERCYSKEYKERFPTYADCKVSDNFKDYTYFHNWCKRQKGYECKDESGNFYRLDKDLLSDGSKIYSEDVCVFLPHLINSNIIVKSKTKLTYDYKIKKEDRLRSLAEQYQDSIDKRAYEALMNYTVKIDD